ncbi:MAG: hypothetical protein M3N16_08790 [Actinomycetota bacterium]|nr:hypothetical protein [Actinomycetota bacterium]
MGRRQRRRRQAAAPGAGAPEDATSDYTDAEGNVLTLRDRLSTGTLRRYAELEQSATASGEDVWQRRQEFLFERLAVRWTIAGLPLERQDELLGRYRLASPDERRWVRETVDEHVRTHLPELTP